MSAAAWVLGALFVVACALLIIALGSAESYRAETLRVRAVAATRLAEARRAAYFDPCDAQGPHEQPCHLPVGHPGQHWTFSGRLLAGEWSDA